MLNIDEKCTYSIHFKIYQHPVLELFKITALWNSENKLNSTSISAYGQKCYQMEK